MLAKGIISAIYKDQKKISVILPEHDNMTTQPLQIYGTTNIKDYSVNEFVVVLVFNGNFNDAMVLAKHFKFNGQIYIEFICVIDESGALVLKTEPEEQTEFSAQIENEVFVLKAESEEQTQIQSSIIDGVLVLDDT